MRKVVGVFAVAGSAISKFGGSGLSQNDGSRFFAQRHTHCILRGKVPLVNRRPISRWKIDRFNVVFEPDRDAGQRLG